jgi:hypothetical protein
MSNPMTAKKPSTRLAWVGSITAVFSLVAGIYGGWSFLSGQFERRGAINRLLAAAAVQSHASDYESAWKTLLQADTIDPGSERVQEAQQDVAIQWLDNIRILEDQTFASITEKLEPVLSRGATTAKSPQRQADLLAHVGWTYFLRRRERPSGPDPEPTYRDALLKDPTNPYGHAMWAHWIVWNHQGITKASEHFAAALASPRRALNPYIRSMQLSAFHNEDTPEALAEFIRVTNDIRKEHGDLQPPWPHDILNIYWEHIVPPNDQKAVFLTAVPPPDHVAIFDWVLQRAGHDDPDSLTHAYIRSALLEAAGRRDEALAGYRAIESHLERDSGGSTLASATRKAVVRLSR